MNTNLKKYLPMILFGLGLLVFLGAIFFVVKGKNTNNTDVEEESDIVAEIPMNQRPVTTLSPIKDGHWLKLEIKDIKVKAASLDYELIYKTQDGSTQGVPGTVKLEKTTSIERELLMGSESAGKFRYDEGVEEGTLTLRFRNDKGKLIGKLTTDFHLQSGTKELSSLDGKFKYTLASAPKGEFYVVMNTFGLPKDANVSEGPYGIFASSDKVTGEPDGEWKKMDYSQTTSLGIFYK